MPATPFERRALTCSVLLAVILQSIDVTIANVALPSMQGSLSATQDQIHWVLTSYVVAAAITTPITGYLATRFGRRRVFLVVVVGFIAASFMCGLATSLTEIVAFRFIQGVFGAPLVPLTQSVMFDINPGGRRGPAMALFGMGIMVGPIVGPYLGGWLTEHYSWRYVFYINVPIGLVAFLGLSTFLPETDAERDRRFDWFGFGTLALAIGALQYMLDRGHQLDWFSSIEIVTAAVLCGLASYLFLVHFLTVDRSFIERRIFLDRNFVVGLCMVAVVGMNLLATLTLVTPYMQNLMGYPAITAGQILAPRGLGTMAGMWIVGQLINRVDARLLILFGFIMTITFLWESSQFTPDVSADTLLRTGLVHGFGLGFMFVPVNTLTFSSLPAELRTQGTSLYGLMRNLGSSVGAAIVVFVFGHSAQVTHATLAIHATPFNEALRHAGRHWDLATMAGRAALNREITRQAEVIAYADDFLLMMVIFILMIPLIFLFKPLPPVASEPAPATAGA